MADKYQYHDQEAAHLARVASSFTALVSILIRHPFLVFSGGGSQTCITFDSEKESKKGKGMEKESPILANGAGRLMSPLQICV